MRRVFPKTAPAQQARAARGAAKVATRKTVGATKVKPRPGSRKKRVIGRKPPLKIPPLLLEGDPVSAVTAGGPGQRYALGPGAGPSEGWEVPRELPESYGTGRLLLTARDPHWLYAAWDLSGAQLRRYNRLSTKGRMSLRVYRGGMKGKPFAEVLLHPESRHWFVHVEDGGFSFVAQLGYYAKGRRWTVVATSGAAATPLDSLAEETPARFASVPPATPLPELAQWVEAELGHKAPLMDGLQELRASGAVAPGGWGDSTTEAPRHRAGETVEGESGARNSGPLTPSAVAERGDDDPNRELRSTSKAGGSPAVHGQPEDAPPSAPRHGAGEPVEGESGARGSGPLTPSGAAERGDDDPNRSLPTTSKTGRSSALHGESEGAAPSAQRSQSSEAEGGGRGEWTREQAAALAGMTQPEDLKRWRSGSAELAEMVALSTFNLQPSTYLRRSGSAELAEMVGEAVQPSALAGAAWPELPAGVSSPAAPFGRADEARGGKGFWLQVSAELVVYGATEPDAQVELGGRPILLRPDGTFSVRVALPDGEYELPIEAVSADGAQGRGVRLKFRRASEYHPGTFVGQ